jgi:ATP-dependent Lon protease
MGERRGRGRDRAQAEAVLSMAASEALDAKVRAVFGPKAVPKGLVRQAHGLSRVPTFVSEYLIGTRLEAAGDLREAVAQAEHLVATYCPRPEDRELLRHRLLTQQQVVVLDCLTVRVDLDARVHWAEVPCLAESNAHIGVEIVDRYPGLLHAGLWGSVTLRFTPDFEIAGRAHPVEVVAFQPLQLEVDLEDFCARRRAFSEVEWVDLLLSSAGYDPSALTPQPRLKLLLLCRLLPLVEPRLNLIELGPKNTGKTHLLRNLSPHAFVISGGRSTPANLFFNLRTQQLGVIGIRRAVVFDEVGKVQLSDADGTLSILKDYMEAGQFSRGRQTFAADASIVFQGNLDVEAGMPAAHYHDLFEPLAPPLRDPALLDRVHAFIPGWELPKLSPASLATGYGLLVDYFAETLNALRDQPFEAALAAAFGGRAALPGMTRRDQVAIERVARGLLKLLHPDGAITPASAVTALGLAVELRQRVHNQLALMDPGEFRPRQIGFEDLEPSMPADFTVARRLRDWDRIVNERPRVGEITALTTLVNVWGEIVGGDVQLIEASALERGRGGLDIVGVHGDEMEQSARAAYNYIQNHAAELGVSIDLIKSKTIVAHLLSISTPREGPSAGLAFLIAIVSALTGVAVRPALAVTGEASLHGRVTGVGGAFPKLMAARDHGRRRVILPAENEPDVARIPPDALGDLAIVYVNTVQEALAAALGRIA